jgi:hypothetical protein
MCGQILTVCIMEHASIFDDTLRRGIRKILSAKISGLEWARLKLTLDMGGVGSFDNYNTAKSSFVVSYIRSVSSILSSTFQSSMIHRNVQYDR